MYKHDIKMFAELWSIRHEVWAILKEGLKALPGCIKTDVKSFKSLKSYRSSTVHEWIF